MALAENSSRAHFLLKKTKKKKSELRHLKQKPIKLTVPEFVALLFTGIFAGSTFTFASVAAVGTG